MITPEQAAEIVGVSLRTIFSWVEAGRVHFDESPDQLLSICLTSLEGMRNANSSLSREPWGLREPLA